MTIRKPRFQGHEPFNAIVRQDWIKSIEVSPDRFEATLYRPKSEQSNVTDSDYQNETVSNLDTHQDHIDYNDPELVSVLDCPDEQESFFMLDGGDQSAGEGEEPLMIKVAAQNVPVGSVLEWDEETESGVRTVWWYVHRIIGYGTANVGSIYICIPMRDFNEGPLVNSRSLYLPDGIDDYFEISEVLLMANDTLEVSFIAPTFNSGLHESLLSSLSGDPNDRILVRKEHDGSWSVSGCDSIFELDGTPTSHGDIFPLDGKEHTAKFKVTTGRSLRYIGKTTGLTLEHMAGFAIYDLRIAAMSGDRCYLFNDKGEKFARDIWSDVSQSPEIWKYELGEKVIETPDSIMFGTDYYAKEILPNQSYIVELDVTTSRPLSLYLGSVTDRKIAGVESGKHKYSVFTNDNDIDGALFIKAEEALDGPVIVDLRSVSVRKATHGAVHNFNEERWFEHRINDDDVLNPAKPIYKTSYMLDGIDDYLEFSRFSFNDSDEFSISFDLKVRPQLSIGIVLGQLGGDNLYLSVNSEGYLSLSDFAGAQLFSLFPIADSIERKVKIGRAGETFYLTIDGQNHDSYQFKYNGHFNAIGRNVYGLYLDGQITNLSFVKNGVLINQYPLDKIGNDDEFADELNPQSSRPNVWSGEKVFDIEDNENVITASEVVKDTWYEVIITHPNNLPESTFRVRDSNTTFVWVGGTPLTQTRAIFKAEKSEITIQMNGKQVGGEVKVVLKEYSHALASNFNYENWERVKIENV